MPKAKTKITTKAKSKAPPREGLALIDATYQRKTAREPDLKRELMLLRQSNDAAALAVVYDAYMAAADAMMGMENQPRAKNSNLLEGEWNWLILKAWTVAEQIARLQPNDHDRRPSLKYSSIPLSIWATGSTARTRPSKRTWLSAPPSKPI
jgi:hypothetical protein